MLLNGYWPGPFPWHAEFVVEPGTGEFLPEEFGHAIVPYAEDVD